ncbi:sugar phosphate nucleotidyltransferase, partial [Bacillus anthracis]
PYVEEFANQKEGAKVLLQSVDDPERFGVANIQNRKIIEIEEKPKEPKSSYAVTGIYLYDPKVFSYIKELKPSARGELEITDINNWYLKRGVLTYNEMSGWWTDAGTHVSLQRANALARDINFGKQFNGE